MLQREISSNFVPADSAQPSAIAGTTCLHGERQLEVQETGWQQNPAECEDEFKL
jgi:hypothetical protein